MNRLIQDPWAHHFSNFEWVSIKELLLVVSISDRLVKLAVYGHQLNALKSQTNVRIA
jgi:hypothetical protein